MNDYKKRMALIMNACNRINQDTSKLVLTSEIDIQRITIGFQHQLIKPIPGIVLAAFGLEGIPLVTSILTPGFKIQIELLNTSRSQMEVIPIIFCKGTHKQVVPIALRHARILSGQIQVVEDEFDQPMRIDRITLLRLE